MSTCTELVDNSSVFTLLQSKGEGGTKFIAAASYSPVQTGDGNKRFIPETQVAEGQPSLCRSGFCIRSTAEILRELLKV